MKALLLSDIPPCSNYTGGVVLADECRLLDEGSVAAFVVLNPHLRPEPASGLDWIPTQIETKPCEFGMHNGHGLLSATAREGYRAIVQKSKLVRSAVEFGRAHECDRVWAILEGQTVIRMAVSVARTLGVPLHTQVWDPPSWWLQAHHVDPFNGFRILRHFERAIRQSRCCGTASWAMAEEYSASYGVRTIPLVSSYPAGAAKAPRAGLRQPDRVTIGMIGQFYARDAWQSLLAGLAASSWKVNGKDVQIYYLGKEPLADVPAERLVHGGWRAPVDAIAALSDNADLCYCPYPFGRDLKEVARLSFPSKVVLYMAAGLPVLCHAPLYSSPARYFMRNKAGVVCGDMDPLAVIGILKWLTSDSGVFSTTAQFAHRAFLADFEASRLRNNLRTMLG